METGERTATGAADDGEDKEQDALQEHLLLLLADSNLPTGGFVASAGLESFAAHGMLRTHSSTPSAQLLSFLSASLGSYARSSVPYLLDAYLVCSNTNSDVLAKLKKLDGSYDAALLSSVARRASTAQGAALLTLYAVALADPPLLSKGETQDEKVTSKPRAVLESLRKAVRLGDAHGHLPVCWGVFAAALGIEQGRAVRMHLFLQARAILSSAIRLNVLGPYAAHGLLHHHVSALLSSALRNCGAEPRTGLMSSAPTAAASEKEGKVRDKDTEQGWAWDWDEEGAWASSEAVAGAGGAPAVTWPLGELTQARHDALHSRMFNS